MIKNISNKSDLIINNVYLLDTDNNGIDSSLVSSYSFTIFTKNTPTADYQAIDNQRYNDNIHRLYVDSSVLKKLSSGQIYYRTDININDTNFSDQQNNIVVDHVTDYYLDSDNPRSADYDIDSSIINDLSARIQDNSINISVNLLKINRLTTDVNDVSSRFLDQQNLIDTYTTQVNTNKINIKYNNVLINDVSTNVLTLSTHLDSSYKELLYDVHNIDPQDLSVNAYSKSEIDSSYNVLDSKIIDLSTNLIDLSTNISDNYVNTIQFDSSFNDLSTNISDNSLKINDLSSNLGTNITAEINDLSTAIKSDYVKINQFDSSFADLSTNIIDLSTNFVDLSTNISKNYVKTSQFDTSFNDISTNVYSKAYLDTSFDSLTAELGNINTILSSL